MHSLSFCSPPAVAAAQSIDNGPTRIDLPALDLAYNTEDGFRAPSMAQSLALSETFYEGTHRAIQRAWGTIEGARSFHQPLYWLTKIGAASYVMSGTSNETNADTDTPGSRRR